MEVVLCDWVVTLHHVCTSGTHVVLKKIGASWILGLGNCVALTKVGVRVRLGILQKVVWRRKIRLLEKLGC